MKRWSLYHKIRTILLVLCVAICGVCCVLVGCGQTPQVEAPDTTIGNDEEKKDDNTNGDTTGGNTSNGDTTGGNGGNTTGGNSGNTDNENPAQEKPLSQVEIGNVRVQLLAQTLVRVEEKGPKGFEDRESYLVTNRTDWEEVSYTQTTQNGVVILQTDYYDVYVNENAASISDAHVTDKQGAILWQYEGETSTNVYLPSPSDALECWYFSDSPRIIPSEAGYSILEEETYLQGWDFDNDAPDFYIFVPNGSYKTFCQDYTDLTGKSEMISLQMLGYWDSRWYAYSTETALQQIQDYRDKGYSIDVLVIDTDWRKSSSTGGVGYEINTDLFPDVSAFIEQCHEQGVNIIFNDHPEPVGGSTNGLDSAEVKYRNSKLTLILSLGLDYWWYDRNWSVALNSCDPDISVYAFGMYCYEWVTQEYLESITDLDEYAERALLMANVDGCLNGTWKYASDLTAHRYSIQWTGDIGASSDALAQEIYTAIFGGAEVGLPYVSSDIGGHTSAVSDDMYVRWMQYGALSTILRVHCTSVSSIGQDGRMPWLFGETAEEVTHMYVSMRYRLLPLYYALARENYDTGLPIMRRLDIEYPQYEEASRNDEYLLGENILIAPIAQSEVLEQVPDEWLSHTEGTTTVAGLQAKYYNNKNYTGSYISKVDSNIYFDWGTGGPSGCGSDNFSIIWTGTITFGNKQTCLKFFSDDGISVYIDGKLVINGTNVYDTLLSTSYYEANSTHTIEVHYFEDGGNAHVYMYYSVLEDDGSTPLTSRTVFIPDGEWIDVWTGTRYMGPQTITVAHGLTTSPIFVRAGAVIVLAEDMQYTSEKDWSNMALDIYPGATSTTTTLYEDDTTTQAYKDGYYRTTAITQTYNQDTGSFVVTVGATQGTFSGDRACTTRTWTVRIHADSAWGSLVYAKLNGKFVNVSSYAQDSSASPFSFNGSSPDGKVYTFTFTADVTTENVIEFIFTNPYTAQEAPTYDNTAVDFTLSYDEVGSYLDLTEDADLDWAYFGADDNLTTVRKDNATTLIGTPTSYDSNWSFTDSVVDVSWSNGTTIASAADITSGIVSQKDFEFTLQTTGTKAYYVIYAAGFKCTAKLTVRDRAGNVQTVTFGNMEGKFCKRVIIECNSTEVTLLYVTYAVQSCVAQGTGSPSNVALNVVYVASALPTTKTYPAVEVGATIASSQTPDATTNLTADDIIDWATFQNAGDRVNHEVGGYIGNVIFNAGQGFYDYSSVISWSNGKEQKTQTGTRNGTCTPGQITISVTVDKNVSDIILYTGAWRSKNTVYVYDRAGNLIAQTETFSAGENAVTRKIDIAISVKERTKVTILIVSTDAYNSGNVSLAAIAVKGTTTQQEALVEEKKDV